MRVHLIKKHTIEDYASINPRSRIALKSWLAILKYADWNTKIKQHGNIEV
jgi:mRNA interferase HigB